MQLRNSAQGYGAVVIVLHWLTVMLVVLAWLLGTFGDELPRGAIQSTGLLAHISIGLAILALLLVRIGCRLFDPAPPLEPTRLGIWLHVIAKLTHLVLCGLLIATPIVGILLQFARGDALPIFGIAEIVSPWVRDRALARSLTGVHELLANALLILAAVHAIAALTHHWVWHDRTLRRMLPGIRAVGQPRHPRLPDAF
jgi:cytochrome b561